VAKKTGSSLVSGGANNCVKELRHANAPLLTFIKDIRLSTSCSTILSTIENQNQVHSTSEKENNADMEY